MSHDNGVAEQAGAGIAEQVADAAVALRSIRATSPFPSRHLHARRSMIEALPPAVRDGLAVTHPRLIGSLGGAPTALRCQANRNRLHMLRDLAESRGDDSLVERFDELDGDGRRNWLVLPEEPDSMSVELAGSPDALDRADSVVLAVAAFMDRDDAVAAGRVLAQRIAPATVTEVAKTETTTPVPVVALTFPSLERMNPQQETEAVLALGETLKLAPVDHATEASRDAATAPATRPVQVGGIGEGATPAFRACQVASFDTLTIASPHGGIIVPPEHIEPKLSMAQRFGQRFAHVLSRGIER